MKGDKKCSFLTAVFFILFFVFQGTLSAQQNSGAGMDRTHETVHEKGTETPEMTMPHSGMEEYPPVSWRDPKVPLSPPPPLTGKQMGQVHTLNVPPLGYEMDGDVKVFTLVAQPVTRFLTDGRMPDESFIQAYNRFTGGMHHMNAPKEVKLWGYNGSMPGPTR